MPNTKTAQQALTLPDLGQLPKNMTFEQGINAISNIESVVLMHQSQIVIMRYMAGRVVHAIMESTDESTYGKSIIDDISAKTGIGRNILRMSKRLYEHFIGKEDEFVTWVNDKRRHWQAVEGMLKADTDPTVLGEEAHAERLKRRAERFMRDLDEMSSLAEAGDQEALGIMEAAKEEVSRFRNALAQKDTTKIEPVRADDYLGFIRAQDCCLCGAEGPSEAHHVAQGGMSTKGSDLSCIPLCHKCHSDIEDKGHGWATRKFKVSLTAIICDSLHFYMTSRRMELPKVLVADSIPF